MAKNRYLIFQHLFNYQIYKIEGNNFREITDEVFIDEENTTYCFYGYDMSRIGVGHFDTGNDFAKISRSFCTAADKDSFGNNIESCFLAIFTEQFNRFNRSFFIIS